MSCHHRSTIQHCKGIYNNPTTRRNFHSFLRTEWITTGNNWPLIAYASECVIQAVRETQVYTSLLNVDGGMQTVASFVVLMFASAVSMILYPEATKVEC